MIAERKLRLTFPPALLDQPVVYGLIRQYEILTNILEAEVTADHGCLTVLLRGDEHALAKALEWLESQGVSVERLESDPPRQ